MFRAAAGTGDGAATPGEADFIQAWRATPAAAQGGIVETLIGTVKGPGFVAAGRAMNRVGRRRFLRGLGVGAAAFPFVRLVANSRADQAGLPPPLRFIGVYHPHGIAAELFAMRDGETETKFDLTVPGQPAAALRRSRDLRTDLQGQDRRHRGHRRAVGYERP